MFLILLLKALELTSYSNFNSILNQEIMKIINTIKTVAASALLLLASCNDFGDINENPDVPTTAEPTFLITNAIYKIGNQTATNAFEHNGALMQYYGKYDFNDLDHYKIETNSSFWVNNYKNLGDLNDVIDAEKSNLSMKAIAKILKAYTGALLTDLYGPVPFFEAGNKNILTPKYDTQEQIYTAENGVLDLLKKAISTLNSDTGIITGDVLFAGNKNQWIKFANVLRLKYLLRISKVYPSAKNEIQQIANSGNIFTSNDENAILDYTQEPNNWFLATVRSGDFQVYSITSTILTMLNDKQDPRLAFYYKPNASDTYIGITPGSNDRTGGYTSLSDNYRAADVVKMVFSTYFEQEFILAEAALENYIDNSTAQTHYENAVKAAFNYRAVQIPTDYLTNPSKGLWDGSLETIINQKYLSHIFIGYEAWFDYRRTGFPSLTPAINNNNSDKIPVRFKYPSEESFTNKQNNTEAISWLGNNSYDAKSWWDKN